jgi:hypothetical protein
MIGISYTEQQKSVISHQGGLKPYSRNKNSVNCQVYVHKLQVNFHHTRSDMCGIT